MHAPTHLGQTIGESATFQELFAERTQDSDQPLQESRAKQVVDLLVSACLGTFPGFFQSLGLPSTTEELDQMTPYELATMVFNRWELAEVPTAQTRSVSPEWKRDLLQFCVQAILYRFNILIKPKYRQLFLSE